MGPLPVRLRPFTEPDPELFDRFAGGTCAVGAVRVGRVQAAGPVPAALGTSRGVASGRVLVILGTPERLDGD